MRMMIYRAPSVANAMARVRAEMGPDALILATRRVADGIEVTAALEPVAEQAPAPLPDPGRNAMLTWHGVPSGLAARLADWPLETALGEVLKFGSLAFEGEVPRALLLTGPPGAGKTLTIARLAARMVMADVTPMVITTDGQRAGATEQLAAFTRLLGLTLIVADHPTTLARALMRRQPGCPVLIDTTGTDPFDVAQIADITGLAATANAQTALVLPAGLDAFEAADLAEAFAAGGATMLVATRLDLARRLGGVLAAADRGGMALIEAGIGPGAADGLAALTPALLAHHLERNAPAHLPPEYSS